MVLRNRFWWLAVALFVGHQFTERVLDWPLPLLDNYLDPFVGASLLLGLHSLEREYIWRQSPRLSVLSVVVGAIFFIVVSEYLFPRWRSAFTADWVDALMIGLGAVYYWVLVNGPEEK